MKCYVCNYEGKFGRIEVNSLTGSASMCGVFNGTSCGSVTIHVCPNCGALHSDMKDNILAKDRRR